jgi:hypothetical protein
LEFDKRARGVSLVMGASRPLLDVIEEPLVGTTGSAGRDHSRKWSPEVASRSVDCFWDEGGSHNRRVTGYECVASAVRVKSMEYLEVPGTYTSGGVCVKLASKIWI